jgi:hypothetical protein
MSLSSLNSHNSRHNGHGTQGAFAKRSVANGLLALIVLMGLVACIPWTGKDTSPNNPYFVTTQTTVVKKIAVPAGTRLIYERHRFKYGQQDTMLPEEKLEFITLPEGVTIDWGGVPITKILQFANLEKPGFTVVADFNQLKKSNETSFSELWQSCNDHLGIVIKSKDDWSFNTKNIVDVTSCGVNNQRFFKEDTAQQKKLDQLYRELQKMPVK